LAVDNVIATIKRKQAYFYCPPCIYCSLSWIVAWHADAAVV